MKKLCKLDRKEILRSLEDIATVICKPRYICGQCARVSRDKSLLCKPVKIPDRKKKK